MVPDTLFQRAIKRTCPWFEPQFSHRKSWKECAVAQAQRSKPGVDIVPELKAVGPHDFKAIPPLVTLTERLENRYISDDIYTSDHGIRVDLGATWACELMRRRDLHGMEYGYEPWCDYDSKVISLPHMLVIMTVSFSDEQPKGDIVIKFRGASQNLEPDMYEKCFGMPSMLIFGAHVFLVMPSPLSCWALFYLVDREFQKLAEIEGYNESVSYNDGLIYYFRGGSHHVLQPQLDGDPVLSSESSGSISDWVWIGNRNDCWDPRYMAVPTKPGMFIVDVARRLMVRGVGDGHVIRVAGGGS